MSSAAPLAPSPRLVVRDLAKRFGEVAVVSGFDLDVSEGDVVALLGPSGCGKTTALRLVAGFESPDAGYIQIRGHEVARAAPSRWVPPERRRVGMVFQDYALFPHLTVAGNIGFGVGGVHDARVSWAAGLVGLQPELDRYPNQLSGGQQQRVALARALAPGPDILLLDEPFSNLDARSRAHVREEVRDILRRTGATAIFVTHDQEEAFFMGDRVAVMENGAVAQVGRPETVFHSPVSLEVADFLGETSLLLGRVTPAGIETPLGLLPQRVAAADDGCVLVLVRPDDVELAADRDGTAIVNQRVFRGMHYRYRVTLESGEMLKCLADHCVALDPGTRVQVRIRACHPLACFAEGRNVTLEDDGLQSVPE